MDLDRLHDENITHALITKDYAFIEGAQIKLHLAENEKQAQALDEGVGFVNDSELRRVGIVETSPFEEDVEAGRTTIVSFYDKEVENEVFDALDDRDGFRFDDRIGDGGLYFVDPETRNELHKVEEWSEDLSIEQSLRTALRGPDFLTDDQPTTDASVTAKP